MLHYIRHAEKDFRNGEADLFKHDPGITEVGVERSKKIALKLVELHGKPTKIISSPFRRARETALIMNSVLDNSFEEIIIDNNLSEYLGNHNHVNLDVMISTKIHNPPHPENFDSMKKRVRIHLEKMKKRLENDSKENIWFITHGIIVNTVASNYGLKSSKQIPYLSCFCIQETSDLIKAEFLLFRGALKHQSRNSSKSSSKSSETFSFDKKIKDTSKQVENYESNRKKRIELLKQTDYPRLNKMLINPNNDYTGRDDLSGRSKLY